MINVFKKAKELDRKRLYRHAIHKNDAQERRNKNVNALVGRIPRRIRATACKHKSEKHVNRQESQAETERNTRFVWVL
jgi:hypothetical protein